jgi:hypothetical protein
LEEPGTKPAKPRRSPRKKNATAEVVSVPESVGEKVPSAIEPEAVKEKKPARPRRTAKKSEPEASVSETALPAEKPKTVRKPRAKKKVTESEGHEAD